MRLSFRVLLKQSSPSIYVQQAQRFLNTISKATIQLAFIGPSLSNDDIDHSLRQESICIASGSLRNFLLLNLV